MAAARIGLELFIENNRFLSILDRATGKVTRLTRLSRQTRQAFKEAGEAGRLSFGKLAAGAGSLIAAIQSARVALEQLVSQPIQKSAALETMKLQLEQFVGTPDAARQEVQKLVDFAANTPFQLPGIVQADRLLLSFGKTNLATEKNLKMVGDAAAATGQPLDNMAFWFGRAYSAIQSGAPLGEVMARLQEFGIAVPGVKEKLAAMQRQGVSAKEQWALFTSQFQRTSGAMEKLSKTVEGRISTLKDTWDAFQRSVGNAGPLETTRIAVEALIGQLEKANETGALAKKIGSIVTNTAFGLAEFALKVQRVYFGLRIVFAKFVQGVLFTLGTAQVKTAELRQWFLDFALDVAGRVASLVNRIAEAVNSALGKTDFGNAMVANLEKLSDKLLAIGDGARTIHKNALDGTKESIALMQDTAREYAQEAQTAIDESYRMSGKLNQAHLEVIKTVEKQAETTKTAAKETAAATDEWADAEAARLNALATQYADAGQKIVEGMRTTSEKMAIQARDLGYAYQQGRINVDEYTAALKRLRREYLESETSEARSILDGLKTESQDLQDQIATLEASRAALVEQGYSPEQINAGVQQLRQHLSDLQTDTSLLGEISQTVSDSVSNLFVSFLTQAQSTKEAFGSVLQSLQNVLIKYIKKELAVRFSAEKIKELLARRSIARNNQEASANMVGATADVNKAHASIPFVGAIIAAGLIALMLASMKKAKSESSKTRVRGFATGGRVAHEQLALVGEAGPEIIAPEKNFIAEVNALVRSGEIRLADVRPVRREIEQITQTVRGLDQGSGQVTKQININGDVYPDERFYEKVFDAQNTLDLEAGL